MALFHVEAVACARIEEVVAATEKEIAQIKSEKAAVDALLHKV